MSISNWTCKEGTQGRTAQCFLKRCYANFIVRAMLEHHLACTEDPRYNHIDCKNPQTYLKKEDITLRTALYSHLECLPDSLLNLGNLNTLQIDLTKIEEKYSNNQSVSTTLTTAIPTCRAMILGIWQEFGLYDFISRKDTQGTKSVEAIKTQYDLDQLNSLHQNNHQNDNSLQLSTKISGANYIGTKDETVEAKPE